MNIRIDHHAGDELANLGFPWCVTEDGQLQKHFRTHMEALKYCLQRLSR